MSIDEAVNNALDDLSLVENKRFINLMEALYDRVDNDVSEDSIEEVTMAIGEFVSTADKK